MDSYINPHITRTGLFLVRVWTEGGGDAEEKESSSNVEWHGRVQRVVDGEAHEFDNLQGLVDTLNKMLSGGEGEGL